MSHSRKLDDGDTWLELTSESLEVGIAYDWAVVPRCGAIVVFSGTVRDHADGRVGVTQLNYEAFDTEVLRKFTEIAVEMRQRWASLGRIALIHRLGAVQLGQSSVLVVVSAPHRTEAFAAAQFGIDALKATTPIWKREKWADGDDWAGRGQEIVEIKDLHTFAQESLSQ